MSTQSTEGDVMPILARTFARLEFVALAEFKRAGLSDHEAKAEATSFAYSAAEVLENRLGEHSISEVT